MFERGDNNWNPFSKGDIVLLGLRDFQDGKADVIMKYTAEEARKLKADGELPESLKVVDTANQAEEDDDCAYDFEDI